MSSRDPMTLFQLSISAKTVSSDFFSLVKERIEAKKKREFKGLPWYVIIKLILLAVPMLNALSR